MKNEAAETSRLAPWIVIFSASLFFFYEFIQMHMFNAISQSLISSFNINAEQLGYVSASYFYADVLFLFPAGMILDRLSTRKVILTAMWICVLGTIFFSQAHSIWIAAVCHFTAGIGNAFCFLSCLRLASRWFSNRQMALVVGLIVTMAMLGGVVAQTPLTLLVAKVGWRDALLVAAGLGLVIIGIVWRFVRDCPPGKEDLYLAQKQHVKTLGVWNSIHVVLKNPQNWYCGLYTSFMNLPLMLLGGLWGSMYLTTVHHLDKIQSSYVTSMVFVGTIFGGPLIGLISDRLSLRRKPMIIFGILALPIMLAIMYLRHLSLMELNFLFLALGFITAAQCISYPTIGESNPKSISGTALGLASVLIMGSPAIFEPFFGWLMDHYWDGKHVENGMHVYPAAAYHLPMLIFPVLLVVSLVSAFLVKETFAREKA